jgi:hypothetical protein
LILPARSADDDPRFGIDGEFGITPRDREGPPCACRELVGARGLERRDSLELGCSVRTCQVQISVLSGGEVDSAQQAMINTTSEHRTESVGTMSLDMI